MGFPGGSAGKESACNAEDLRSILGSGRSLGKGNSYPLLYAGLKNSVDCRVQRVTKSRTQLSDFFFFFQNTEFYRKCVRAKSCPTLCNPVDSSWPGSSVHEILHTRVLEWVGMPFSSRSSQPSD